MIPCRLFKLARSFRGSPPMPVAKRALATATATTEAKHPQKPPKTGIVLFNLGGPSTTEEVYPFLHRLFSDPDLIPIPFQKYLAPWIARRRTPSIQEQYAKIGGGSPIRMWTEKQAQLLVQQLDQQCPESAPHKTYIAFRYAPPLTEDTLAEMERDGVKRAIGFTQYPQYSCSTTGSSINELVRKLKARSSNKMEWSFIDRWPTHPGLVKAFAHLISEKLTAAYPPENRDKVVLLFSAHSLPMSVVNRGDTYPQEVASTVHAVMNQLGFSNPFRLVWQSQVGPAPWLGPRTDHALEGLAKKGVKDVMLVPIAFTSDHVETLFELDLEYGAEAKKLGITGLTRCDSLNDHPLFIQAMAEVVKEHLDKGELASKQFWMQCPTCTKESCTNARTFFQNTELASTSEEMRVGEETQPVKVKATA